MQVIILVFYKVKLSLNSFFVFFQSFIFIYHFEDYFFAIFDLAVFFLAYHQNVFYRFVLLRNQFICMG